MAKNNHFKYESKQGTNQLIDMTCKNLEKCPFCGEYFPLDKGLCPNSSCFAYRVDFDNYHLSLKERKDLAEEFNRKKGV